jgi:hypothetical protein
VSGDRCEVCDRADCATLAGPTYASISDDWTRAMIHANAWSAKVADCRSRAVDWRARALAAEAALPSPAPVSEPTGEEVAAVEVVLHEAYRTVGTSGIDGWRAVARAALALGARPPTKETT